ncbi:Uncharacterised protein [Chlamydia abortus]|nr:Uncharacterised protein [Chlamydia abortus]
MYCPISHSGSYSLALSKGISLLGFSHTSTISFSQKTSISPVLGLIFTETLASSLSVFFAAIFKADSIAPMITGR